MSRSKPELSERLRLVSDYAFPMPSPYLLALLILIPAVSYLVARRRFSKYAYCITGTAFGAIVSPWALGLYSFYYLSPWGVLLGFLGLALTLTHGVPGFKLAIHLELIPRGVVSGAASHLIIESINAVVWALIYGLIGLGIDTLRRRGGSGSERLRESTGQV